MVPVLYAAVRNRNGEVLEVGRRSAIESYVDCFNRRASDALAQVSSRPVSVRVIREAVKA